MQENVNKNDVIDQGRVHQVCAYVRRTYRWLHSAAKHQSAAATQRRRRRRRRTTTNQHHCSARSSRHFNDPLRTSTMTFNQLMQWQRRKKCIHERRRCEGVLSWAAYVQWAPQHCSGCNNIECWGHARSPVTHRCTAAQQVHKTPLRRGMMLLNCAPAQHGTARALTIHADLQYLPAHVPVLLGNRSQSSNWILSIHLKLNRTQVPFLQLTGAVVRDKAKDGAVYAIRAWFKYNTTLSAVV